MRCRSKLTNKITQIDANDPQNFYQNRRVLRCACGHGNRKRIMNVAATRRHLSSPIAERIFLAGETTSFGEHATVLGAHKEGLRAAKTVGELLG